MPSDHLQSLVAKCYSLFYYKVRWSVITKDNSFLYYKVRQVILQSATGLVKIVTKQPIQTPF